MAHSLAGVTQSTRADDRGRHIVDVLVDAFSDLMAADADAFRTKFRKMAADPFAFYRGSACLFYADMAALEDRWCDERTSRVWIQGDLHAENFGTYMDSAGRIVFDVNDFDEAYLGHVSWDLRRFAASFALMAWRKALSDDAIGELIGVYLRSYLDQVEAFTRSDEDRSFALVKGNTHGAVRDVILETATRTRLALLQRITVVEEHERRFADRPQNRRLDDGERAEVMAALDRYRETVVPARRRRDVAYDVKDDVWEAGIGKALYYVRGLLEAYKAQGVNEKEVHISVVLHGPTVYWMLNEAAYRRFKNDEFDFNPHEQVLQELLHHGVSIEVCNATLRGKGWNENDLLPGVIRVHDAYTRLIELQQLGYAYIRF